MNYRHIYHAGNRCDVVKHAVLILVLTHLRAKDKGFVVLDTHAGVGLYDLNDPRGQKTGEATLGIGAVLKAPPHPELSDYYAILRKLNPLWDGTDQTNFRVYPGSPLIAFHMLRASDRLIACELHTEDAQSLRQCAPADKRMQIHHRDGYEAMGAFLPPPEKRGLVFIDPPYERADEFEWLVKKVTETHRRWPTGIYMIWYPLKDRPAIWKFHEALACSGLKNILYTEFFYEQEINVQSLNGSGLIFVNPPWQLDKQISVLFSALQESMGLPDAKTAVKWLTEV